MMARNHKNDQEDIDRRLALKSLTGIAILCPASAGLRKLLNLGGWVEGASAAVPTPTIPVIVKCSPPTSTLRKGPPRLWPKT